MLPTIIEPTHTAMTHPKPGLSMEMILRTFPPKAARAVRMAWGYSRTDEIKAKTIDG
jgi:hypothetical protein